MNPKDFLNTAKVDKAKEKTDHKEKKYGNTTIKRSNEIDEFDKAPIHKVKAQYVKSGVQKKSNLRRDLKSSHTMQEEQRMNVKNLSFNGITKLSDKFPVIRKIKVDFHDSLSYVIIYAFLERILMENTFKFLRNDFLNIHNTTKSSIFSDLQSTYRDSGYDFIRDILLIKKDDTIQEVINDNSSIITVNIS